MQEQRRKLERESTVQLIRRIVEKSDRQALHVLLETRRLFRLKDNKPPLLLSEFLMVLHDRIAPPEESHFEACRLADCTYDLTLEKYTNLPDPQDDKPQGKQSKEKGTSTDCRKYYRAFLQVIERINERGEIKTQLQEEAHASAVLQPLVYKNFLWSKLECKRYTPFAVRYTYEIGDKKIYLWYPSHMTVEGFKSWLKENTKEINMAVPGAQKQVQNLIDKCLGRGFQFSFEQYGANRIPGAIDPSSAFQIKEGRLFVQQLAQVVAEEKSEGVNDLRPAISKIGKDAVKELVLQIFFELDQDDYRLTPLAEKYGISKAALSRFAGSKWFEKADTNDEANDKVEIPDLWKNTAQVLAADPMFLETVASTGFSGCLEWVLSRIEDKEGESDE
ncbi:MAG: hypothetical protein CVU57_23560 [Deltaproteobacteria bacterium HGW-Deltaproteobacteria-15]|jgi:hypothetical protein|nr:MAG: hypothetical protein CVU57_23560 [Deltaproteobacteria bacterium HGW-Deltaproteobacteria-15]